MIRAHVFRQGREVTDIEIDTLSEVRTEKGTLVWVDLISPTERELAQMGEEFGIHELALEDLSHSHRRPKLEDYPGQVLLVAYGAKVNERTGRAKLHAVRDPRRAGGHLLPGAGHDRRAGREPRAGDLRGAAEPGLLEHLRAAQGADRDPAGRRADARRHGGAAAARPRSVHQLGWRFGYGYALGLMVGAASGLWVYFRRKRWL